jgi:hypothetical protein
MSPSAMAASPATQAGLMSGRVGTSGDAQKPHAVLAGSFLPAHRTHFVSALTLRREGSTTHPTAGVIRRPGWGSNGTTASSPHVAHVVRKQPARRVHNVGGGALVHLSFGTAHQCKVLRFGM